MPTKPGSKEPKSTPIEAVDALAWAQKRLSHVSFGQMVRSLRICEELSQKELAARLGVSPQFLSNVETDRKQVGVAFARKVGEALGGFGLAVLVQLLLRDQLRREGLEAEVAVTFASRRAS
jgi:transcriptional regulator with XRE-family HTH domain